RALRHDARGCQRRVRVILWDGEESPGAGDDGDFLGTGVRGSRADAAATARRTHRAIAVDMVGDRDLSIPREDASDAPLWRRLRAAAGRVGVGAVFPARSRSPIADDHYPYLERGVRAIDVIDLRYPAWHTTGDDLSQVSPRSLDAVGEALVELLREMRA